MKKDSLVVIGFLLTFVSPLYSQVNGKIISPTFSSVSQFVSSSFELSSSSIVLTNRSSYKLEIVNIFPDGINAISTELNNNFQPGESIKIPATKSSSNGVRCFRSIAYKAADFDNENKSKGCELMKLQAKMGREVCTAINGTNSCFNDAASVLEQNNWCDNSSEQSFQGNQQNNSQQTKSNNNNTANKNKNTTETGYEVNQSIESIGKKLIAEREEKQNQQEQNELDEANEKFNNELNSGKYVSETCTECDGSGFNSCEKCNGAGGEKCYACNGKGTETCGMCSGTGTWLNQTCTTCGGKGTKECYTCSGEGFKKCLYCNGKGKMTCHYCDGVGKIAKRSPIKDKESFTNSAKKNIVSTNSIKNENNNVDIVKTIAILNDKLKCCIMQDDALTDFEKNKFLSTLSNSYLQIRAIDNGNISFSYSRQNTGALSSDFDLKTYNDNLEVHENRVYIKYFDLVARYLKISFTDVKAAQAFFDNLNKLKRLSLNQAK